MTKLKVDLSLPTQTGFLKEKIHCKGIVVRQEKQPTGKPSPLLTAIYFSEIKTEDRRRIAEFILQSMLSHAHRRS